jgi:hypothetical protein
MKKLFLAFILAGSALSASAQYSKPATTTFGIRGGMNLASVQISADGSSTTANTGKLTSFSAGLFADIAVNDGFSIQPGLFYSGKGFKLDGLGASVDFGSGNAFSSTGEAKTHISYVQVPVNFIFNVPTSAGKFYIGAGPFASVAIRARLKGYGEDTETINGKTTTVREDFDEKVEIGSDDGIKRFDYGATGLAGFRFSNGISVNATYDLGLANISGGSSDEGKMKTRTIGFSLGFNF